MREMRLKKREITDPKILRKILESCEVVRIGAMDEEGMFIVPMNYGYAVREEDGTLHVCLYLHGAKEGRKAAAFAADPRVAVEMDYNHEVITGDGKVRFVQQDQPCFVLSKFIYIRVAARCRNSRIDQLNHQVDEL